MSGLAEDDFVAFVHARWTPLLRSCVLLAGSRDRGEELLQETLAKLWRARGRIEGDPEPFTRQVAVRTATSWWRRRWRAEIAVGELPERAARDDFGGLDDRAVLLAALATLPARQRAAVVLRVVEDLPESRAAALMGCSVGTVKTHLSRGLARLREMEELRDLVTTSDGSEAE